MTIDEVRRENPHLKIYDIADPEFRQYGRVLTGYNVNGMEEAVFGTEEMPAQGSRYVPDIPALRELPEVRRLALAVYGGLPIQAGVCMGCNKIFNGVEFHQGSETTVALTDIVFFAGKKSDIEEESYQSRLSECFYAKKGTVFEMYDTTLHYCPCSVNDNFVTVVILLRGTNTPLAMPSGLLVKKNKWFLTHKSNKMKVKSGCVPGFLGDIKYIN